MSTQEPPSVLYVTDGSATGTQLPDLVAQSDAVQLTEVTTRTAAVTELDDSPVDCVIVVSDPADHDLASFLETLRDHDPTVPLVVAPKETHVDPKTIPTGVTEYLPPSVDDLRRRDLLTSRIETLTDPPATPPTRYSVLAELVSTATDPSVPFDTALQRILEPLGQFLSVEFLSVFECSDDGLELRDRYDLTTTQHTTDRSTTSSCSTDPIATLEQPSSLTTLPAETRDALGHEPPGVVVPIRLNGDLVGLLVGAGASPSPTEELFFAHGAEVLSWCFRRRAYIEREARIEEQNEKIRSLHQVAADLDSASTPDAVYEMLIDAAESILEFDIAIADAVEDGYLVPKAVSSDLSADQYYDETPVDQSDSVAATVYQTGETSLVNDTREAAAIPADTRFLSVLTVSIGDYGVFQAAAESVDAFDDTDLELTELLVTHGRDRLRQLEQTQQLEAYTDTLERQNERLDAFTSVVSHDLRNPLQVATGNLHRIKAADPEEPIATAVNHIDQSLDRMESLIDNLLALATEGTLIDTLASTPIHHVAQDAWETIPTANATLTVETEVEVVADAPRLQQLFENLFANAIDHGGSDVSITVGALPDQPGFYVCDDGPGIDPDDRELIFEHGYTTSAEGTGVGLEIVADIVAAHDWTITVTESSSGGARFEITGVELADTDEDE